MKKQEKKNIPYAISNLDIGFQTVSAEIMASGSNEMICIGVKRYYIIGLNSSIIVMKHEFSLNAFNGKSIAIAGKDSA